MPIRRRQVVQGGLALAGLGLLAGCGVLQPSPPPKKVPRIGYLGPGLSGPYPGLLDGFREGLRDLGYVDGESIAIEYRFTDEGLARAPGFAADLVGLGVDAIVTTGAEAGIVARDATTTIPIVGAILGPDPVAMGLVTSLARPGSNVTGLSTASGGGQAAKRVQLLKEVLPGAGRVALIWNANNPYKAADVTETERTATLLGMQTQSVIVRRDDEIEGAFQAVVTSRPDALIVLQDPLTAVHSARIVAFAAERRLPAMYEVRLWTDAGGLMQYGVNSVALFRRAATYVDRILKGARPGDLPVEQPTTYDFVVNLRTARALGLTVPPSILAQATEIIQE